MQTNGVNAIDGKDIAIEGRFLKTARLRDEYYVPMSNPADFIQRFREEGGADLLTFVQELDDRTPRFQYHQEFDDVAVLPLTTYEDWFEKQLRFKARNRFRRSLKRGAQTRLVEFSDDLVHGIMGVYNETKIRQGKANRHFGKTFETVRREHATFLDRSEFIGAYFENELIGFVKVTHSPNYSIVMNIVSMVAHRDKSTTNALMAKTIEVVTARKVPLLKYGIWGRLGLNEFKTACAFEKFQIPRYYVPLTTKGEIALKCGLHQGIKARLPEEWLVFASDLRAKWSRTRLGRQATTASMAAGDRISESSEEAAAHV